jgi:phosphoadenosine phosphosulfate reductase
MSEASPEIAKQTDDEVRRVIDEDALESLTAPEILSWAVEKFHPRLALSASFGGPEGMVLLHLMHQVDPSSRVFVLDTGRLHQATYDLIDRVRDRFDLNVEVVFPRSEDVQEMVREKGMNLFYESLENRQLCCRLRKVEPMRRFLSGLDAYMTGLRREQNVTRANTPKVMIDDAAGGIVKINPMADWTYDEVWKYIRRNNVPVNRLHAEGYPSVGCAPCSRAIKDGEDPRAGRWWWEQPDTKECGIHSGEEEGGSGI